MKIKLQIQDIIILITIASTLLNVVFRNLPQGIGSFKFLWAPLTLIIIFFFRPIIFTKRPIIFVLLFGAITVGILQNTLWNYIDDWNRKGVLEEFYNLTIFTAIWSYYWLKGDLKRLAFIGKWSFVFIVISLIMTNIALTLDPLVVRNAAANFLGNPFQARIFKLTGSASFGYAQAFVVLIPVFVYHIKKRKNLVFSQIGVIAILTLLLVTTIRAMVFANLLVAAFITIFAFMGPPKHYHIYYALLLLIILVINSVSFFANTLTTLGSYFEPNSQLYDKFNDLAIFIENPELDTYTMVGTRAARYPLLIEELFANPLLGYASYNSSFNVAAGGHLYWMNKLALWGIPGFLFFVFVLYKIYKTIISAFVDPEIRFYYFLSVAAFIMLGLSKNISGRETWLILIVVIPGLYFLPLLQQKEMAISNNVINDRNN